MSIRITRTTEARKTVLRVDGQLTCEDVEELAREYRSVQGSLALELTDLRSADPAGVAVLQDLVGLGAEIRGASPYIELLLKRPSKTED